MGSATIKGIIGGVVALAALITIIVVVVKCMNRLETSQVAITYNTYSKELNSEVYYEGLHLGHPALRYIMFSSVFQTLSYSGKACNNLDGVTVTVSISMQYKVRPSYIRTIVEQFRDSSGYVAMLQRVGSAAILDVCCLFNTTQLQSERGRFQEELGKRIVNQFDWMHTDVQDIQVNNINRPYQYEKAIKGKESAREDISVALRERPRQLTEAETGKREALHEADIIMNSARSEVKIMNAQADAEGQAILNDYKKEAESYKKLKDANGLDNVGFLAYMGVRAIANAKNPVYVNMKGPAKTSFTP